VTKREARPLWHGLLRNAGEPDTVLKPGLHCGALPGLLAVFAQVRWAAGLSLPSQDR
jgi:hypothetical protein